MNSRVDVSLRPTAAQRSQLHELQRAFSEVCNALAPTVQQTRCWNRVALHHMAYRGLRTQFPNIGSQLICNAIYSVSRACRIVFQAKGSPFNLANLGNRPLPLLRFSTQSPVYFDRHTLSVKNGEISMFTLDGRMKFQFAIDAATERRFREEKLREIVLKKSNEEFVLTFLFSDPDAPNLHGKGRTEEDNTQEPGAIPGHLQVSTDQATTPANIAPEPMRPYP